jgi:glucosamine-6-phosphate deaminase
MNLIDTIKGSDLENFYPSGWDLQRIDDCCATPPERVFDRQPHWNDKFELTECDDVATFNVKMGHAIASEIKNRRSDGRELALILSAGPMGMYKWATYFLKEWNVSCDHVHGFNMDEWADAKGNSFDPSKKGSFQNCMEEQFYDNLGNLTIPASQRNFATKENLPLYPEKIDRIVAKGGKLVTIYGIGRCFHIAFWEPHFAADFNSVEEWKKEPYRVGAKLHPLTIEQNSLITFKSRFTMAPAYANTIGPGIFLKSESVIGGVDGVVGRGMNWQGTTFFVTLRYGPDIWVPSSWMPTIPGKFFFVKELAGPLLPENN